MAIYNGSNDIAFTEKNISTYPLFVLINNNHPSFKHPASRSKRTLQKAAVAVAADCAEDLTPAMLQSVPFHLGQEIFHRIVSKSVPMRYTSSRRRKDVRILFKVWKVFVTAYSQDAPDGYFRDLRGSIASDLSYTLPSGLQIGTSWLTHISIHTSVLDFQDLFMLSTVQSLAILMINGGDHAWKGIGSEADDRLIRNWARTAGHDGFANLRIISFHGCQHLTAHCLKYLYLFPSLSYVYFDRCTQMHKETYCAGQISEEDYLGWKRDDICDGPEETFEYSLQAQLEEPDGTQVKGDLWVLWHARVIRKLQLEEEEEREEEQQQKALYCPPPSLSNPPTPVQKPKRERDFKKPILHLCYGNLPKPTDWPLVLRRDPSDSVKQAILRSTRTEPAEPAEQNQSQTGGDTARQLKRRKLNDANDFAAMLSNN